MMTFNLFLFSAHPGIINRMIEQTIVRMRKFRQPICTVKSALLGALQRFRAMILDAKKLVHEQAVLVMLRRQIEQIPVSMFSRKCRYCDKCMTVARGRACPRDPELSQFCVRDAVREERRRRLKFDLLSMQSASMK